MCISYSLYESRNLSIPQIISDIFCTLVYYLLLTKDENFLHVSKIINHRRIHMNKKDNDIISCIYCECLNEFKVFYIYQIFWDIYCR